MAERHSRDVLSLVLGLLLLVVAGVYLLTDLTPDLVDWRWAGPGLLIATGIGGLVASVRRRPS